MARKPGFIVGLVLMLLMIMSACAGGTDPVTGSLPGGDEGLSTARDSSATSSRMLWGFWTCIVDTETDTVEVVPLRGAMMHVNAVEWLQPPNGSLANLGVEIIDDSNFLTEGRIDVNVRLTHPFPGLDQYTGFDVMGVYMTDGHVPIQSQVDVDMTDGGGLDSALLNPDGYTRWWNQAEFADQPISIFSYIPGQVGINREGLDAIINPYKYFTDDIGNEDLVEDFTAGNVEARGVFSAGSTIIRRYNLVWPLVGPTPAFAFDYAVVASWVPPLNQPPIVPDDYPISANALEPIALDITDSSDLFYSGTTYGGDVVLDLELYSWQGLDPDQDIDDTIKRVIVEFQPSPVFPTGTYYAEDSSSWMVSPATEITSVWHVEIPGLQPEATGPAPALVIFETIFDYDNGFGTGFPLSSVLSSYFATAIEVYGAAGIPTCEPPTPEFTERNWLEIEDFSTVTGSPGGGSYNIDWSIEPTGDPKDWVNTDTDDITVNWFTATDFGSILGDYDVCVSVYSPEGFSECCATVTVDDTPELQPVTGQNGITLPQQPDQGAQRPDLCVWNSGSNSVGQVLNQDILSEVRMYRFSDSYGSIVGSNALSHTGYDPPLDNPQSWNDFHKFDVRPTGGHVIATSASPLWPSISDPLGYNINDPYHAYILPYANMTGASQMLGLYADLGTSGAPDPDVVPWKHVVDWTAGAAHYLTRMYGLMTISEEWIPNHPTETHPGTIWALYAVAPYADIATDFDPVGVGLSTQGLGSGDIDDTAPNIMALGVDDDCPIQADWSAGPGDLLSDIVVWYMLSSESTVTDRKVHLVLLPEDISIPFDIYYYEDYIGIASPWGLDFGGDVPIDVETIWANQTSNMSKVFNWFAVLLDTGTGWRVDVYRYDPLFGSIALVDIYEDLFVTGTPTALDIDNDENEIHVLYNDAGTYKVVVLEWTP